MKTNETPNADVTFEDALRAKYNDAQNVRPETIASDLHLPNGKQVRAFLRGTFPRDPAMKGSTWLLTNEQAKATIEHFIARRAANALANANAS